MDNPSPGRTDVLPDDEITTVVSQPRNPVGFFDVTGCKFPVNSANKRAIGTLLFCNDPRTAGKPYCAHHCGIAYGGRIALEPFVFGRRRDK